MLALSLVWVGLLVIDLGWGLTPELEAIGTAVWAIFAVDLALRLVAAEHRLTYLRANWLAVVSLAVPALRVFRLTRLLPALRAARTARGLRLLRLLGTMNRGLRALGATMVRRGVGYVVGATVLVWLAGSAGMYAFERDAPEPTVFDGFGSALWWTAMVLTTMGSEQWPRTAEGRLLCVLLAIYAFVVFGYITAALASYFVGRDAARDGDATQAIRELRDEVAALRESLATRARTSARCDPG